MQSRHQVADGDIQLSNPGSPDNIDDRYLTSRAYGRPAFAGAAVTVLAPRTEGSTTWDRLRFQVNTGRPLVCRSKSEQLPCKDQVEGYRFKCSLPHEQRTSKTGTNVRPYGVSEYRTRRGKPCS
jgi:hypothetical protein